MIWLDIKPNNSSAKNYLRQIIDRLEIGGIRSKGHCRRYTMQQVEHAVAESICFSDVCRKLKLTTYGSNIKSIKKLIIQNNIDITHFDARMAMVRDRGYHTLETLFIIDCGAARATVKKFILKYKLIDYKCRACGITEYNGKSLSLELEHKNGIYNDNRLENLEFLCPNCHSQTETFSNKRRRIK